MKYIYEILDAFVAANTRTDKINVLRRNETDTLKAVLQGVFHPGIQFTIKEIPEYTRSDAPAGLGYTDINSEIKRIYLFTEGSTRTDPNLTPARKNQILIQMLEAMEPREADVFKGLILKDLQIPGLGAKEVNEAFPGLIPE